MIRLWTYDELMMTWWWTNDELITCFQWNILKKYIFDLHGTYHHKVEIRWDVTHSATQPMEAGWLSFSIFLVWNLHPRDWNNLDTFKIRKLGLGYFIHPVKTSPLSFFLITRNKKRELLAIKVENELILISAVKYKLVDFKQHPHHVS